MTLGELEAALSHYMTMTLGVTWDSEDHTLADVIAHTKEMAGGKAIISRSEFDSLVAMGRRFDMKKRSEKQIADTGSTMEEQRKQNLKKAKLDMEKRYETDADEMLAKLDKSRKVKHTRTSMIMLDAKSRPSM